MKNNTKKKRNAYWILLRLNATRHCVTVAVFTVTAVVVVIKVLSMDGEFPVVVSSAILCVVFPIIVVVIVIVIVVVRPVILASGQRRRIVIAIYTRRHPVSYWPSVSCSRVVAFLSYVDKLFLALWMVRWPAF